jgi:MFS family permease
VFVAMFGVAGLANTVYHPADYALLSQHVAPERAGRVFSFHTFAGMLGNAATPPALLFLHSVVGWRGAFLAAAVLGLLAAAVLVWIGEPGEPAGTSIAPRPVCARCGNAARESITGPRTFVACSSSISAAESFSRECGPDRRSDRRSGIPPSCLRMET